MKNIREEDREFYELFNKYNELELCGFYELFESYDNKELIKIVKDVYKEKTGKNLTKKELDERSEEYSIDMIKRRTSELDEEQLSLLENIVMSAEYFLFENPDVNIEEKFEQDYIDYLKFSIDIVLEFIAHQNGNVKTLGLRYDF